MARNAPTLSPSWRSRPASAATSLIKSAQPLEIGWIRNKDPRDDAGSRRVTDGVLADRKRLEQRRMRILVRLRHDADLAHDTLFVDFAGGAISAGPVSDRPASDTLIVGKRHLVVFAIVFPDILGPGLLDDLERLLVDSAVMVVDRRPIHRRAGDVVLLAEDIDPTVLVAARETGIDAPLGQVIEYSE